MPLRYKRQEYFDISKWALNSSKKIIQKESDNVNLIKQKDMKPKIHENRRRIIEKWTRQQILQKEHKKRPGNMIMSLCLYMNETM